MDSNQKLRLILFATVHVAFVFGLVMGFESAFAIITDVIKIVSKNTVSAYGVVTNVYNHVISLDRFFLVGSGMGAALLFYDMHVLSKWFFGFTFVDERQCKSCQIKLVRKEREQLDHWLSYIFPVRRFICIGCGKQYLRADRGHKKHHKVPKSAKTAEVYSITKIDG